MRFKKVIKLFEKGNVCVCGLRGRGKDLLMSNVVVRRRLPYVCNIDYGGERYPFSYLDLDCGSNTYQNFIRGSVNYYRYPFPDGTDVYLSDAGIYFLRSSVASLIVSFHTCPFFKLFPGTLVIAIFISMLRI